MERSEDMSIDKKNSKNRKPILNHRGTLKKSSASLPLLFVAPKEQMQRQVGAMDKQKLYRSKKPKGKRNHAPRTPVNQTATEQVTPQSTSPTSMDAKDLTQENNRPQQELIQAKVVYVEKAGQSFMQVAFLEEIWDVEWVHSLRVPWKLDWKEMECQSKIDVQHVRHDDSKKIVWLSGEVEIKGLGFTVHSQKVEHETIRIPFTSTVLRPSLPKANVGTSAILLTAPACPTNRWVETGDWQINITADPLTHSQSGWKGFSGLATISGRVWWYRKQLVPVPPPYITKKVNSLF
ncbi:hypothetical protein [Brevibacillus porteri]|uniref:Uncharacterized protein n=1 Tax=Brevibacillus porteri TaxID=2126350 RepID=A0ABX5FYF2_9BACL|nr:hypothetical protein [Brevibacillus porteri]MED1798800.1 hypothetical protein [Brevibacillus porteri]MED2131483.1 hypothetical protein [Brevibacillus porteri]MED2744037.1 hypothetical protein [Brevibacillus porteri]MED2813251.1 hypothetical protein [Brevibacillus porteri]MED2896568.1 hypothetical protein [Brevibacillus porteri]